MSFALALLAVVVGVCHKSHLTFSLALMVYVSSNLATRSGGHVCLSLVDNAGGVGCVFLDHWCFGTSGTDFGIPSS